MADRRRPRLLSRRGAHAPAPPANGHGTGVPDNAYRARLDLASADDSFPFLADVVYWAWWEGPDPVPPDVARIALSGITHRAETVSSAHRLTARARLHSELARALTHWQPVGDSPVRARGYCLSVDADPDLLAAVEEHERTIRQELAASWHEQYRARQEERTRSLLLDPLRATARWLHDNPDRTLEAVTVAEHFLRLRGVLSPEERAESPGALVDELLAVADAEVRVRVLHALRQCFQAYGRDDLVRRLPSPDE